MYVCVCEKIVWDVIMLWHERTLRGTETEERQNQSLRIFCGFGYSYYGSMGEMLYGRDGLVGW